MQAFFAASGPAFRKGQTLPSFPNVDLYDVMCSVLGIKPASNNGTATFDGLKPSNNDTEIANLTSIFYVILGCILGASFCTLFVCFANYLKSKLRIRRYKSIPEYNLDTDLDDEDTLFFNDIKR